LSGWEIYRIEGVVPLQEFLSRGEFMQYMDRFKAELKEDFAEITSNVTR